MSEETTQPLEAEAQGGAPLTTPHGRPEPLSIFTPSNQNDSPQSTRASSRLNATDFFSLVRSSSAAIACVEFPTSASPPPQCSSAFSDDLYRLPSRCLEASKSFARLRGYPSADALLDQQLTALAPPGDGFRSLFAEWHRGGFAIDGVEWRVFDANGAQRLVHAALYPTFEGEALTRMWIVLRDISALARAIDAATHTELHYRALLEHPHLLYLRSYADGAVSYASDVARRELDINATLSAHLDDLLETACHPDDREALERLNYHRRALSQASISVTLRLICRQSGLTTYNVIQHPYLVRNEVEAFDFVASKAPQPSEVLSETALSAGLAHDANNQLLVASAAIERVRQLIPASNTSRHLLDSALRAIAHCASIHSQSIQLSTGLTSCRQSVDLIELFEDVTLQCEAILPEGITVRSSVQQGPISTWADPTHLNQILINLILNARDVLGSSGVITLRATRKGRTTSEPSAIRARRVCLSVSDNGPGIDPTIRERIFQPFVSTKSSSPTRGLGLAMVKTLVEKNGGDIAVTSARGFGTTFTVSLPEAPSHAATCPRAREEPPMHLSTHDKRVRALIADDEPEVRKTLLWSLIALGAQAAAVPDATSLARELARPNNDYNLIILDDGMPGSTAPPLRDKVREISPTTPIIITSGDSSLATCIANAPMYRFLAKPFTLADLARCVDSLLGTSG